MIEYIQNENEIGYDVAISTDEKVQELARELEKAGFGIYAKRFYTSKNGGPPYFVIPKPYAKENENEPDSVNMWIDVTHEYTVTAQHYYHTHFDKAQDAVKMVRDFYDERLAEYLVVVPNFTIAFVQEAKENWEDALNLLAEYDKLVSSVYEQMASAIPEGSHHCHSYRYGVGLPLNDVIVAKENNRPLYGRDVYRISAIFGRQAEYYFDGN
ncbi:MAG: hypothetical protein IJ400_04625 [Clostridia bacterium]|nr:hypothetical protein [Clostridia bacterium]